MDRVKKLFVIFGIPLVFFFVSLFTLKDYGVNWDSPIHFARGQAYYHLLTTRSTTFEDVSSDTRKSYFQNDSYNARYYIKEDSGHPPVNGIIASAFNQIFFQKLGLMGDIQSYHLFIIVSATLLVTVVVFFAFQEFGWLAALVSGIAISTYPLFFAESHFNIKDPVAASFFGLTIWFFWKSLNGWDIKWLLLSILSFSLSLGTKFNVFFLPLIIFPYLLIKYSDVLKGGLKKIVTFLSNIPKKYILVLLISPLLVALFLYLFWPFLRDKPWLNIMKIMNYYRDIGTGRDYQTGYSFMGLNLYPIYWIVVTTPPFVLLLTLAGFASIFLKRLSKNKTEILWLIWLAVPILRVSLPGMSIYGGVRQIMEYIPAIALISGLGAGSIYYWLTKHFKINKFVLAAFFLIGFVPQFWVMWKIHPNQNIYFNFLVGGLKGAKQKNIPSAGDSFGNAYWQAVKWINQNAESNSKLALIQGTGQNIPKIQLRDDIYFSNNNWSGIDRKGEYLLELNIEPSSWAYPYAWEYATSVLNPVYEVRVDGVVLATVWKNDLINTKPEFRKSEILIYPRKVQVKEKTIDVILNDPKILTRVYLIFNSKQCSTFNAKIETTVDGLNWKVERDAIPADQVYVSNREKNMVPFFFPGREAQIIRLIRSDGNYCEEIPKVKIWVLE